MSEENITKNQGQVGQVSEAIEFMAQTLKDHPGFMWTPSGVQVLHVDWPAYPFGRGMRAALAALTDFPDGLDFFRIDSVDACTLFVAGDVKGNKYDPSHFHVALWDDDVRELATRCFVSGVSLVGQNELEYENTGVQVTGFGHHASLYFQLSKTVRPEIVVKVEELVLQERYDTAVRESALLLENRLRDLTRSAEFGEALVNRCFGTNGGLVPPTFTNAERLQLRASFRRYFRYVRNEFAHNFKSLSLLTTCRLLTLSSDLYNVADSCSRLTLKP